MLKCTVLVLWCLFISVKGGTTGFDIVRPTPVLKLAPMIQSTDASNPLKANKESEPKILSTGISNELSKDAIVNPTPVLLGFETTDASNHIVKEDVPLINLLTTRPLQDNLLLNPSPVINVAVMETSAENPSIPNKEEGPTPVLIDFQTTDAALPLASKDFPIPKQFTRPVDINLMVSPSPVLNIPMLMETNADNPLFWNKVETPQLSTTVVENDTKVLPTPAVINRDLETNPLEKPIAIALVNDDIPELSLPSTGTLIEPSQVMDVKNEESTSIPTPNLEDQEPIQVHKINLEPQGPIQVSSTELMIHSKSQKTIDPCKCSYYKEIMPMPETDSHSQDAGNVLTPPKDLVTPKTPKISVSRPYPPPIILQHIVSLQFNFFVNNIPVLAANPPPFFF